MAVGNYIQYSRVLGGGYGRVLLVSPEDSVKLGNVDDAVDELDSVNLRQLRRSIITIQNNGTSLPNRPLLNFVGFTVVDNEDNTITVTSSGGTWGSITGTIANQTDLINLFNTKQDVITYAGNGGDVYFKGAGNTIGYNSNFNINSDALQLRSSKLLRFYNIDNTFYVQFKALDSLTANFTHVWPTGYGLDGHALLTNGAGSLSWGNPSISINNNLDNRVLTANGGFSSIDAEINLTYDGLTLNSNNFAASPLESIAYGSIAIQGYGDADTTGTKVALFGYGINRGSGTAIGTIGLTYGEYGTGKKIGVLGRVSKVATSYAIGGYFDIHGGVFDTSVPTFTTNAALVANNGNLPSPIFLGLDNGTTVFSILDGGSVQIHPLSGVGDRYIGVDLNGVVKVLGTPIDTLSAVGATPNINGASIAGTTLTLQPADATRPGLLTELPQNIGGNKNFVGDITVTRQLFTGFHPSYNPLAMIGINMIRDVKLTEIITPSDILNSVTLVTGAFGFPRAIFIKYRVVARRPDTGGIKVFEADAILKNNASIGSPTFTVVYQDGDMSTATASITAGNSIDFTGVSGVTVNWCFEAVNLISK